MKTSLYLILVLLCVSCNKNSKEPPLPQVASINLINSASNIILGDTIQLNVSHAPNNAITPEYEWSSDDQNILIVTREGKVYAKSISSAKIVVKIKNSTISSEHKITVIPGIITSLNLDKTPIRLTVNQQEKLNVTVLPLSALTASINWSSSDPLIAQVSSLGIVTAISAGSAVITVMSADGKVTAKSNIEVVNEVTYTRDIFDKIKADLLDQLILYNEQQGKALAQELKAAKVGYIVQAISATETWHLSSNPGYPEAAFSKLTIPSGDIRKINSNFYLELFPNTSRLGLLTLDINFFQKSWEVKGTITKAYTYKYSDNVTLNELKAIIDENVSNVRRYITTGSY